MRAKCNFFFRKHDWSVIKDEILEAYLKPYLAKIARTKKPVVIADCFAGKGRFDDGQSGSPILILDAVDLQLKSTPDVQIKTVFIEKKYFEDLQSNVAGRTNVYPLEGAYEDRMEFFLNKYDARKQNLFLYVDPYGIKSIRFSYFKAISTMGFSSVEVLLNLNARGFLREGCRLLKESCLGFSDIDTGNYEQDVMSPDALDEIAGGIYWRDIIDRYYGKLIEMHQAEEEFVYNYCAKLESVFKYVINTPIKEKMHHIPKYRMVYGTNHPDGLLLMVDNMNKRWKAFRDKSRCGQTVLLECDLPDFSKFDDIREVENRVFECVRKKTDLRALLVCLIQKYGIAFSTSELIKIIKRLEADKLTVTREPSQSPDGKPITGWDYKGNKYILYVERKSECPLDLL